MSEWMNGGPRQASRGSVFVWGGRVRERLQKELYIYIRKRYIAEQIHIKKKL